MNPKILPPDPGPPHPSDLRRVLVLGQPPWPALGLISETIFTPTDGRHIFGSFRVRGGRRISVVVDPDMDPLDYAVEDALTGEVVRTGRVGEGLIEMQAPAGSGAAPRR